MFSVLSKISGFLLIIGLGYYLKYKGVTKKSDGVLIGNLVLNVTLPCALLTSVSNIKIGLMDLSLIILAIVANVICLFTIKRINHKNTNSEIAISMLNASGYNIGAFLLPFVQYFYSATAVIYIVLFDIGNSLMLFSGNNAIATSVLNTKKENLFKSIINKCLNSMPFMTYLFILILSVFNLSIPSSINELLLIPAKANVFLSMLMIGTTLDLNINLNHKIIIKNILATKYFVSFVLIGIIVLLPIDSIVKIMLSLALCAPSSIVAVVYSNIIDSKSSIAAITNTISTVISIFLIIFIILITH